MDNQDSNEKIVFSILALVVVLFCFFILSCTTSTPVTYEDIDECFIACESYGGLEEMCRNGGQLGCQCEDGILIWQDIKEVTIYD